MEMVQNKSLHLDCAEEEEEEEIRFRLADELNLSVWSESNITGCGFFLEQLLYTAAVL